MKKKILFSLIAILISLSSVGTVANAASTPYSSLTMNKDKELISTMDGYVPDTLFDKFSEETLKNPQDLFIYKNKELYIADTGNKRVLVTDLSGNFIREITEGLSGPTGVFVTDEGLIYVADEKAKAIFVYDKLGNFLKQFDTPVSPLFGTDAKYQPTKVVVNKAGTIYALSKGNSNGVLTISDYGDFYGYFGANDTNISVADKVKRALFTEEQLNSLKKNVPASAINLDIDETGLIYTVTQGLGAGGLKKFNMAGAGMLDGAYADSLVMDVCVGKLDNIYTISKSGYIMEFTKDGNLIFYFGGNDDGNNRMGLFKTAVAIDVDDAFNLYVLDSDRADVTVFRSTEYASKVHEALGLYQEGYYLESYEPWQEVLKKNSLFDYAYRGISKSLYKLEDYEGAMKAARHGGAKTTYSDAFWRVRNVWIRKNVVTVFWILIIFSILRWSYKKFALRFKAGRFIHEKHEAFKNLKFIRELRFLGYMIKNPADAVYGIKREGKVSVFSASFIYILVFVFYVIDKYTCGFLFKKVSDGYYDLTMDIAKVLGLMLLFVICANLICSIRDGEATLKNVYCGFAYCFAPYIFLKPVQYVLTHVLTYNEKFLISFIQFIMVSGTIILIVVMLREIQCYTYKETFVSILLTLFTMIIILAAGIIIFGLLKQVVDFVIGIFKEAYYRGR